MHDLQLSNMIFLKKTAWDILSRNNWMSMLLKLRFFVKKGKPKMCLNSTIWPAFRNLFHELSEEVHKLPGKNSTPLFWTSNWQGESLVELLNIPFHFGQILSGTFFRLLEKRMGFFVKPSKLLNYYKDFWCK